MGKPLVTVTHWVHPEVEDYLNSFCEPRLTRDRRMRSVSEWLPSCADVEGLMVFMPDSVDESVLSRCPKLRIVAGALKGYDNFDVEAMARRGVPFTIVPDLLTIPTAELAIGLTIGVARKLGVGDRDVRSGSFQGWRPTLFGTGLAGSTVGLIGLGKLGIAVAERLQGFGVALLGHDRGPTPEAERERLGVQLAPLEEVLARSHVVVVLLPLTDETRFFIDDEELARMRPGALLVNVGRGSVVREEAVARSLEEKRLGGYAADVFEFEDWALEDRPVEILPELLRNHEQTLFTPHLGSAVDDIRRQIAMEAAGQLEQFFSGRTPEHLVRPRNA
ncbi:MAG: NAD(P)-dependent oxidoreductase [Verrucomicrobiota bacterium]